MELVRYVNVPNDRITLDGFRIIGESWQDTAVRVEGIIGTPPVSVPRAPAVPIEEQDPDAPPGWYDGPDMAALWGQGRD